jgi:hypothetical protein
MGLPCVFDSLRGGWITPALLERIQLFSTGLRTYFSFTGIKENEFSNKRDKYNLTGGTSGIENRST